MDDEDGFVGFNVSQWDLDNEFNINRPTKRMSKQQAIYGIWADSESDEESEKTNKNKKKRDFTAPVEFVSGGIKDDSKANEKNNNIDNKTETSKKNSKQKYAGLGSNRGFGSNFGGNDFGQWEMYTKGVGSKLLQKMGYQPGKGLGKNLQGITQPIEAKKRPGFGAIGMYGPEITKKADPVVEEETKLKEESEQVKRTDWKREKNKAKKNKVKVYVKSTEEIITESVKNSWSSKNDDNDLEGVKIIDMTGPQQRVLTNLSKLSQSKPEKPKSSYETNSFNTRFDMPELRNNIERLVLLAEKDLLKCHKDHHRDQNQIEILTEEKFRLNKLIEDESIQLDKMEKFFDFVQDLEDKQKHNLLTVEKALTELENFLTEDFKKTIKLVAIDKLILCIFGPLLRQELRTWQPFNVEESKKYFNFFERIKKITVKQKTYEILLWENWNPVICRALQCWPSVKQYEEIIAFVELWRNIIPKWMYEYFVANNLIPRLVTEVQSWNPLTDMLPIHSWIHPWLPVLLVDKFGHDDNIEENKFLFEPIYEIIRMKLASALTNWHPSDSSARLILEPWKGVFSEPSFQSFLDVNIVPKLESIMKSMLINPSHQSMDEWNWVLSWKKLLSLNTLVSILERCFFPNWLNVLYGWLNSGMANFTEIGSWYQGWKSVLGEELVNHLTIKDLLKKALMMMDHAVNLSGGLKTFAAYYNPAAAPNSATVINDNPVVNEFNAPFQTTPAEHTYDKLSFKQMVELKASEKGVLFMPVANRFQDSKQVYQFGQYLVYIENQVIFQQKYVSGKRVWAPVLLQELLDLCRPL